MQIEVWHGARQRVGHLGNAQADFNLMGQLKDHESVDHLYYRVNGENAAVLGIGSAPNGFGDGRRLARSGHFNADIPIANLCDGDNHIDVVAVNDSGEETTARVIVEKYTGSHLLPCTIRWSAVANPQDVGQYVDGHWAIGPHGLRTQHTGYERIFLLGSDTWDDYQITVPVTIHAVDPLLGPNSGDNGLGLVLRFAGHAAKDYSSNTVDQPQWRYRPFGALAGLRWKDGPDMPPQKQFYRGDGNERKNFGECAVMEGKTYVFKAACKRIGPSASTYCCAVWPADEDEPSAWDWQVEQQDERALHGGVALLAHHVNASFGDIEIVRLA